MGQDRCPWSRPPSFWADHLWMRRFLDRDIRGDDERSKKNIQEPVRKFDHDATRRRRAQPEARKTIVAAPLHAK